MKTEIGESRIGILKLRIEEQYYRDFYSKQGKGSENSKSGNIIRKNCIKWGMETSEDSLNGNQVEENQEIWESVANLKLEV
jgi:hypothetical protein